MILREKEINPKVDSSPLYPGFVSVCRGRRLAWIRIHAFRAIDFSSTLWFCISNSVMFTIPFRLLLLPDCSNVFGFFGFVFLGLFVLLSQYTMLSFMFLRTHSKGKARKLSSLSLAWVLCWLLVKTTIKTFG